MGLPLGWASARPVSVVSDCRILLEFVASAGPCTCLGASEACKRRRRHLMKAPTGRDGTETFPTLPSRSSSSPPPTPDAARRRYLTGIEPRPYGVGSSERGA